MIIFKNSFFSSITTLTSGSIIAQLFAILCAPILTRLFTPEELGSFTYLISFATIFMGFINGKYDMAIVTESDGQKVYALIKLSLIVGIVFTFIGTIIFIIYSGLSLNTLDVVDILFIYFVLLSYALINVLTSYNNRQKEYKVMASVNIIRNVCQNIGAVLLGLIHFGKIGLIIPYLIGQYLGIKQQGYTLKKHYEKIRFSKSSELKEVMIKHKRQPLFSAPAALANSFSYSSITIFLNNLFGNSIVGFYSISVRLLGLPLSLISGNVSKVFFESATKEYQNTGKFFNSFKKVFIFQFIIALPMMLIMFIYAPPICEFVFGKEWRISGDYIRILTPMFGIRFIVTTLTPAMIIVKKQNVELLLQMSFVLSSVACFIICRFFQLSIENYLMLISISFSIIYLIYLVFIYFYSKNKFLKRENTIS